MTPVPVAAIDDIRPLLTDWKLHLRAKGSQPSTVASYLAVGTAFADYLAAQGMPTGAARITREHVEH